MAKHLTSMLRMVGAFCAGWTAHGMLIKSGVEKAATRQAEVSRVIDTKHQAQVEKTRIVYRTIYREIPHEIPPEADRDYPLHSGLVRVHDAAALGSSVSEVSDTARSPDDPASTVEPSRFAGVIVENYETCRATSDRLSALQEWVRAQ